MTQAKLIQRTGSLTDYGISETKSGDLQIYMQFDVPEEGGKMTYFGSLKGGALPFTLDALAAVGYKGKDCTDLVEGVDGNALKLGVTVSLAVGDNEYNGTITRRISFVNAPGSGVKQADHATAKAKLRALGMDAELAKHRGTAGKAPTASDDDIPF